MFCVWERFGVLSEEKATNLGWPSTEGKARFPNLAKDWVRGQLLKELKKSLEGGENTLWMRKKCARGLEEEREGWKEKSGQHLIKK